MKMVCDCCGKEGAVTKHISRSFGSGDRIFVIDNIPLIVCPHCGESYFSADTLQELERLKLHHNNVETKRQAPVVEFV